MEEVDRLGRGHAVILRVSVYGLAVPLRGGIDLGGTKIQAIVVDERQEVRASSRRETPHVGGPPDVVAELAATMREACAAAGVEPAELAGVGVGSPGEVDAAAGTVSRASNLPGWDDTFALADALGKELGLHVAVGNDVRVAVEAERVLGAGRTHPSFLGVWWGTGIGGAVVLDGKQWLGRGAAGELGHMVVRLGGARCPCGRRGCIEAYAGRAAMEARARRAHDKGAKTDLFELMRKHKRDRLTSGIWDEALERKDGLAVRLIDRAYAALGAGVASAINLLDLGAVVVGGGLGTRFGEPSAARLADEMYPHLFVSDRPPAVVTSELGDTGGALGAALLVNGAG
jgi:glucokinase